MIGFYDYTVVLTFVSLLSTVFGMTQAMDGHFRIAILCLAISGLCDTFDGKIARSKKDRTEDQKLYGIQLDSLCDVVCFGAFPAMICYLLGLRGILGVLVIGYYCICGVIRLGFFNVLETGRQSGVCGGDKVYHGLAHYIHCGDTAADVSTELCGAGADVSSGAAGNAAG